MMADITPAGDTNNSEVSMVLPPRRLRLGPILRGRMTTSIRDATDADCSESSADWLLCYFPWSDLRIRTDLLPSRAGQREPI